jgi:hypothetical protein
MDGKLGETSTSFEVKRRRISVNGGNRRSIAWEHGSRSGLQDSTPVNSWGNRRAFLLLSPEKRRQEAHEGA